MPHFPLIVLDAVDRDLLAQVVQVSADAIFCFDVSGVVTTWNAAAERLYGYRAEEMLGRRSDDLLPDRTREHLLEVRSRALAGERVERFDTWHRRRDGALVPIAVSVSPLHGPDGAVIGAATSVSDISDRVEVDVALEEARLELQRRHDALARSNRDLEQFAYVASHDLSEPLRVMTGYVTQLERRYDEVLDDKGRRYMQHIVDASTRMRALIDDLLDYSRFLRVDRAVERVELDDVAAEVLMSLRHRVEGTGAVVEVQPMPAVHADRSHVESLLQNLVTNSLKFTAPGDVPRLSLSATREGRWVRLVVDDAGIGIAPEYRERVFRMFQRLHVREEYSGTGIGLAIAQQVVELHGGTIRVEDSPLGGARFACTLPAAPVQPVPVPGDSS